MLPSSRTPEGDSVDCPTCGLSSKLLTSHPAGDSVCPFCGAHLWVNALRARIPEAKQALQDFKVALKTWGNLRDPKHHVSQLLAYGIKNLLAARGAIIWTARSSGPLSQIFMPELMACAGAIDSPEFATEVISRRKPLLRRVEADIDSFLQLGLPLVTSGRAYGAIQVLQRDIQVETTKRGYMIFLAEIAEIASPLVMRQR